MFDVDDVCHVQSMYLFVCLFVCLFVAKFKQEKGGGGEREREGTPPAAIITYHYRDKQQQQQQQQQQRDGDGDGEEFQGITMCNLPTYILILILIDTFLMMLYTSDGGGEDGYADGRSCQFSTRGGRGGRKKEKGREDRRHEIRMFPCLYFLSSLTHITHTRPSFCFVSFEYFWLALKIKNETKKNRAR